ncbi:rhamnogalacturonan acetylesterase [Pelagicoccus sp. SDUM812003]|uniref:rhamnogalacturonan acetylesterase n=1 Tax=Pelagicoccus sp. SDUM812003 TaxID=3041267 RepID=UPI00280F50E7|nr:rhamnogalacturonan acetylesterase [Pelagicoccus sp. SDUM812003]MDQ8203085.1 rhamnogalacturonan acetylesterase [Pelagicoccus sp. SDUM812003]
MPLLRFVFLLAASLCLMGVQGLQAKPQADPISIVVIGDSTAAQKEADRRPETGWAEALQSFFEDGVSVSNRALNGRSSKSFIDEGRWQEALGELEAGDVLIVEFGHNDQKSHDPSRYAAPWDGYASNLRRFAQEAQAKGAEVIILSSICRRKFNEDGTLQDTHGEYPDAAQAVARDVEAAYIDMEALTRDMLLELGPEKSRKLFLHLEPGEHENYPDGKSDDTHLNEAGARAHAELFAGALREMGHPLADRLR